MICKYCKMEVPEGYRYCPNCGLLLDLGKQFTVPERKYTIPKYEYQPKKAEAEAAAPETTQQFLQPQHEESTEEAEARLELELRKALERDARALAAAEKKPTEAVEFSDEDYAQVEQDDSPDAIVLEEKQPAEALVESVTLEATEAEPVQAAEGNEEKTAETEAVAETSLTAEAVEEQTTSETSADVEQKPEDAEAETAAVTAEAIESEAESAVAETEASAQMETSVDAPEASEEVDPSEKDAGDAVAERDAAEMDQEAGEPETAVAYDETEAAEDAGESEAMTETAESPVTVEDSESEEAVTEEGVAEESKAEEKAEAAEVTEAESATEQDEASAAVQKAADGDTEEIEVSTAEAEHRSDLEERIAALLPDDGLDSTKVDEQGNPAFVWDENISFMEAVSEKSVGDFAVEEDERAEAALTEEAEAKVPDESDAEDAEATAVAETQTAAPMPEMTEPTESEAGAEANAAEIVSEPMPEAETVADAAAAAETVPEFDEVAAKETGVVDAAEMTEADTEPAASEDASETAEAASTDEAEAKVLDESDAEEPEASSEAEPETEPAEAEIKEPHLVDIAEAETRHGEKHGRRKKRFLIPLAVCAVAAGAIVVYLNLPAQRTSRALNKGRSYVESNNFTAAVPVLEKLLQSQPDSLEVHLLLSEAYANTDRHAQAVALLEEAKAAYPDNAELLEKLAELNPTVSVSVPSGSYSDPQSIALSNEKGYEIRYQLNDEAEQTYEDEILLSTNGAFTLSAYAVAADGAKGESVSMNYTIQLDPDKYPLDQFVDTADGRQYIDADGAVQTGWMTKDGKTYYFDEKGYMLTGLQTIEDSTYFFDADGVLSTGWQQQDGKYYFFDEKGQMLTSTWIDNQYYVGADGAMLTDTTTPDGVYVNARGQKGFDAAAEFANYPNSIVQAHISTKVDKGDYYEVSASVYHQKTDNKPTGESYDITLKVLKHAKVHYLDNNLPDIIASDAFSFLKEIGMQKIQQDNDGYVTEFSFALGEKRS